MCENINVWMNELFICMQPTDKKVNFTPYWRIWAYLNTAVINLLLDFA